MMKLIRIKAKSCAQFVKSSNSNGVTGERDSVGTGTKQGKKSDKEIQQGRAKRSKKGHSRNFPNTDKQVKFLGTGNHFIPKGFQVPAND